MKWETNKQTGKKKKKEKKRKEKKSKVKKERKKERKKEANSAEIHKLIEANNKPHDIVIYTRVWSPVTTSLVRDSLSSKVKGLYTRAVEPKKSPSLDRPCKQAAQHAIKWLDHPRRRNVTTSMVGLKMVTYAKISPCQKW